MNNDLTKSLAELGEMIDRQNERMHTLKSVLARKQRAIDEAVHYVRYVRFLSDTTACSVWNFLHLEATPTPVGNAVTGRATPVGSPPTDAKPSVVTVCEPTDEAKMKATYTADAFLQGTQRTSSITELQRTPTHDSKVEPPLVVPPIGQPDPSVPQVDWEKVARLKESIKEASAIVAGWPAWKRAYCDAPPQPTNPKKENEMGYRVWECKIVVRGDAELPCGFDQPPRRAAITAVNAAGFDVLCCSSSWTTCNESTWDHIKDRVDYPAVVALPDKNPPQPARPEPSGDTNRDTMTRSDDRAVQLAKILHRFSIEQGMGNLAVLLAPFIAECGGGSRDA